MAIQKRRSFSLNRRPKKEDGTTVYEVGESSDFERHEQERRSGTAKKASRKKVRNKNKEQVQQQKEEREEELRKKGKSGERRRKKRSTDNTEQERPRKKRKRKTTGELLASGRTKAAQKRLSKLSNKATQISNRTEIETVEADEILPPIVPMDFTSEHEFLQEYEHIYETQSTIIRKLEERLTDPDSKINSRDIYALSTMYSQLRETIADMRSIKDMNEQAENLAINVFDPAMKAAGESLVNIYFKITAAMRHHVKDVAVVEMLLDKLKQDIATEGSELQNQLSLSRSKIIEVLSEG